MNNPSFRSRNSSGLGHTNRLHKHVCKRCSSWTTAANTKWHMKRHKQFFCALLYNLYMHEMVKFGKVKSLEFETRDAAHQWKAVNGWTSDGGWIFRWSLLRQQSITIFIIIHLYSLVISCYCMLLYVIVSICLYKLVSNNSQTLTGDFRGFHLMWLVPPCGMPPA
jgi:hypothetical protein